MSQSGRSVPGYWRRACVELARVDTVLGGLVECYAGSVLSSRDDPFATLARSIVGQQISVRAADSVWARLSAALPVVAPEAVLASSEAALRACGLSLRKVDYLRDLACRFATGRIDVRRWKAMDDAQIVAELTAVRGVGVWTAQMALIFSELRPDVFPLDDIGLQKAVARHYLAGQRPTRDVLAAHGERWRPWRSVATWYLWRSLDPVAVEY